MVRKNRLVWIGNVRGLLMAFVVMFHACQQYGTESLMVFLRLLILPLFFFLSGMLLKNNMTFSEFIKQKFNHVLKPYFQFSALTYGIYLVHKIFNHEYMREYNPLNLLMGIFYASNNTVLPLLNLPLWFLPCLFLLQCILFYFLKFPRPVLFLLLILSTCLGGYLGSLPFPLPWSISYAFSYVIFAALGYLLAPKLCRSSAVIHPGIVALCWAIWIAGACYVNSTLVQAGLTPLATYIASVSFTMTVVTYITSTAAVIGWIGLFQRIPKVSYLSTIAKHSIEVLALHAIAFMLVTTLLRRIFHIPVERTSQDLAGILSPAVLYGVILTYITAGLVLPCIYAKYANWLSTRKSQIIVKLKENPILKAAYSIKRFASP